MRKRIKVFTVNDVMHHRRVIEILAKIYTLSKNEVERIYNKMDRKIRETKIAICMTYPELVKA